LPAILGCPARLLYKIHDSLVRDQPPAKQLNPDKIATPEKPINARPAQAG